MKAPQKQVELMDVWLLMSRNQSGFCQRTIILNLDFCIPHRT